MKLQLIVIVFFISFYANSQDTKRVLFLGNSYTYYNDMPGLLSQVASSVGDNIEYQSNAIPNASWSTHVNNGQSRAGIMQGDWDYVVLQGAGRSTARDENYLEEFVYPYVNELNDLIVEYNPCGETMLYMTWGERIGVPFECPNWPPFCSYQTMDDLIRQRHLFMAENYEAVTSPVGAVWRYLRDNDSGIELYNPDGAHPSLAGSYAAAVTFYSSIFKKDPSLVNFNSTLSPSAANAIKEAVRYVVYENLSNWYIGLREPISNFSFESSGNLEYTFINSSEYSIDYLWFFGDGTSSIEENPTHTYDNEGNYEVSLYANYLCSNISISTQIISTTLDIEDFNYREIKIFPNPSNGVIKLFLPNEFIEEITLKVYTITGAEVLNFIISSNDQNNKIDISNLKSGCYLLNFIQNNEVIKTSKLVKK